MTGEVTVVVTFPGVRGDTLLVSLGFLSWCFLSFLPLECLSLDLFPWLTGEVTFVVTFLSFLPFECLSLDFLSWCFLSFLPFRCLSLDFLSWLTGEVTGVVIFFGSLILLGDSLEKSAIIVQFCWCIWQNRLYKEPKELIAFTATLPGFLPLEILFLINLDLICFKVSNKIFNTLTSTFPEFASFWAMPLILIFRCTKLITSLLSRLNCDDTLKEGLSCFTSLTPLSVVIILWTTETTCLMSKGVKDPFLAHLLVWLKSIKNSQLFCLHFFGFLLNFEQSPDTICGFGEGVGDGSELGFTGLVIDFPCAMSNIFWATIAYSVLLKFSRSEKTFWNPDL